MNDHTINIIELKDVTFSYNHTQVLKNINLAIHKGDYLGLIGPNGGGKTTLLKIMIGLLKPQKGTVILFDKEIKDFSDWSKLGYVSQKATNFDPNFPATVEEIVSMGRYAKLGLFRFLSRGDKKIVEKVLEQVGMTDFRDRQIGSLSGGQQQRVFIARALAAEPEIIFLDEPTVGVDLKTQEDFYMLLEKLNMDMQLTLVLVSHDIDVVTGQVTEIACINQELVYHGTPKEFFKEDRLQKHYGKGIKFVDHH